MKYNCPWCDFEFDGVLADTKKIFEHEKKHQENKLDSIIKRRVEETPELLNTMCSHCGCREDHEYSKQEIARVLGQPFEEDELGNAI